MGRLQLQHSFPSCHGLHVLIDAASHPACLVGVREHLHAALARSCTLAAQIGPAARREQQLMQHLAATMRMMVGDIDLTVSDRHCAFVLCQALQQLQRRRRVARCLLPPDKWREQARRLVQV